MCRIAWPNIETHGRASLHKKHRKMDKFDNKYRIESHRFYGWDYSSDGVYFITLVTEDMKYHFDSIEKGKMILSEFGQIVHEQWLKSFEIRTELFLDEFVIMPNHLHGLVVLKNTQNLGMRIVETHGRVSLPNTQGKYVTPFQKKPTPTEFKRKPKSISSFVAGFKSASTKKIDDFIDLQGLEYGKFNRQNKLWQANYHDRIVRDKGEYRRIKKYIQNNPTNWEEDKFHII